MSNAKHLSTTETAKLIRDGLKNAFPGQKFSVRSKTYSGGSSIDIRWIDGPTDSEVSALVDVYSGKGFDGMIDLAYSYTHWLLPDGSVTVASTSGTEGSGGTVPAYKAPKPHPKAELVHLGSGYVFTDRSYSRAAIEQVSAAFYTEYGLGTPPEPVGSDEFGWRPGSDSREAPINMPWSGGNDVSDAVYYTLSQTSYFSRPEATESTPDPEPVTEAEITVEHDRDWTWISFAEKPDEPIREALKTNFGARWSRRRTAWYIRERVPAGDIMAALR